MISWTNYNEWGEITHNAVLKCGARELDLVKEYATHDYDSVLQMYYAKARMYDAYNRRFTAVDPILDGAGYDLKAYVTTPMALNQYLYVRNNAVNWIDPDGKVAVLAGAAAAAKALKDSELIVTAAVAGIAAFIVTPYGQETLQVLADSLGMTIKTFTATTDNILDQIQEATDYFYDIQCSIVNHVETLVRAKMETGEQLKWNKHTVYVHYDTTNGKVYYVGRTNDFSRRYKEHARRILNVHMSSHPIGQDVHREMIPVATGLNFQQSKWMEQVLITAYSIEALDNMRNEISTKNWNEVFKEADRLAELIIGNKGTL